MNIFPLRIFRIIIILFLFFQFINCNKHNTEKRTQEVQTLPDIKGFTIFKKEMTYDSVINMLENKKIKYKIISKKDLENYVTPISFNTTGLVMESDLIKYTNINFIEVYNFRVLDFILKKCKLCFIDEKLTYLDYHDYLKSEKKSDLYLNFVNRLKLLSSISDGLKYRYGSPSFSYGSFDNKNISFEMNDENMTQSGKGIQISARRFWIGKDSLTEVYLDNFYLQDTILQRPLIIEKELATSISVLFDSRGLNNAKAKCKSKIELETKIENEKMKKHNDSIHKTKINSYKNL